MNKRGNPAWTKGISGNPGGNPRGQYNLKQLCRAQTLPAVKTLIDAMQNGETFSVRATAAQAILDRGWGKAGQEIHISQDVTPLDALDAAMLSALIGMLRQQQQLQHGPMLIDQDSSTSH